jgi:DNA-binding transcriptional MerR regulator
MKDKFLIGELSKIFGISTDTLRYYHKVGLLKPDCDLANRYRYYSVKSLFLLSRILFLKSLDISIDEIKNYMKNQTTDHLLDLLKKKEDELDEKIKTLVNLKGKIGGKINLIEGVDKYIEDIRIVRLTARKGIFISIENTENQREIKEAFSKSVTQLAMSSWLVEGQIYTSIAKENLLKGEFQLFSYFIEMLSGREEDNMEELPENDYACIAFCGAYDKFEHYYQRLIKWIHNNGYLIIGNSIEKNIVDYGFTDTEEEYISEIQIPVVKAIGV